MSDFVDPVSTKPTGSFNQLTAKKERTYRYILWAVIGFILVGIALSQSGGEIVQKERVAVGEKIFATDDSYVIPSASSQSSNTKSPGFSIQVTSQIIKRADGKYRYFFDIRNTGSASFEGSVKVRIENPDFSFGVGDEFYTEVPMDSGFGKYGFIDLETAPRFIDPEYGVDRFTWEVIQDFETVDKGQGFLTSKLE